MFKKNKKAASPTKEQDSLADKDVEQSTEPVTEVTINKTIKQPQTNKLVVVGLAVFLVASLAVGGYFVFKPEPEPYVYEPPPLTEEEQEVESTKVVEGVINNIVPTEDGNFAVELKDVTYDEIYGDIGEELLNLYVFKTNTDTRFYVGPGYVRIEGSRVKVGDTANIVFDIDDRIIDILWVQTGASLDD